MRHILQALLQIKNGKETTYLVLLQLALLVKIISGSDEILTLENQNHIKCLTGNLILPMYIFPPIIEDSKKNTSLVVNGTWTNDDWLIKNASSSLRNLQGIVTDKRWEEFRTVFGNTARFYEANSIYVSIYIAKVQNIKFFLHSKKPRKYFPRKPNSTQSWIHYSIFLNNDNKVQILENNKIIYTVENFTLIKIVLKTDVNTFWKMHEYQFKYANSTTKKESTTLTVNPPLGKKCLDLYAFVCATCSLEIFSGKKNVVTYENNTLSSIALPWQHYSIDLKPGEENTISLYRKGNSNNRENEEWGIDIRWCPDVVNNNKLTYEVNAADVSNETRTCYLLQNDDNKMQEENEKNMEAHNIFNCEAGILGTKCDMTCSNLLGVQNPHCGGYRICERSNCKCAWGHYGPYCHYDCKTGYWGLSCENACNFNCTNCNKTTGDCAKKETFKPITVSPEDVTRKDKRLYEKSTKIPDKSSSLSLQDKKRVSTSEVDVSTTKPPQIFETGEVINKTDLSKVVNKTILFGTGAEKNSSKAVNKSVVPSATTIKVVPSNIFQENGLLISILLVLFVIAIAIVFLMVKVYYNKRNQSRQTVRNVNIQERGELLPLNANTTFFTTSNFESVLKIALSDKELELQFHSLPEAIPESSCVALLTENNNKNKDRKTLPYDCTRVVLEKMDGLGSSDYINASYIDGYDRPKAYIACQGPKFSTIRDFWRMIWQENIETIIMATNLIENKKRMCADYWPQGLNAVYECGELTIELIQEQKHEFYDSRMFEICYTRHTRKILHLHFKWNSDDRERFYPNNVLPIIKRIRKIYEESNKPIVIHSSFGVNRTGILILCDLALQMAKTENKIDFYALTRRMREQRPNMINNAQGYVLAHLVVLEYIMEEDNPFNNSIEENMQPSVINKQLKYLERLHWLDTIVQSWIPLCNKINNNLRPVLVDGYGKSGKYLTVEQPTFDAVAEFWTMIATRSIRSILFLNKIKFRLWPYRNATSEIIIKIRELNVTNSAHCTLTELALLAYEKLSGKVLHKNTIAFFELHDWAPNQKVPNSNKNVLNIIRDIMDISENQTPILVAYKGDASASGLFTALYNAIEKYEKELEVDICNAVRIVRRSGTQFLNTSKQLKCIHTSIVDYMQNFESYNQIEK